MAQHPRPARPRPRPLDAEELDRQLADLPGVHRGAPTTLVVALRAPSFAAAVRLVQLVAEDADAMDHHPEVHLRLRTVVFTLTSNAERAVTQWDVELAHRVLEAARTVGAEVLPRPQRVEVTLECADVARVRPFWAAGLAQVERMAADGSVELHDRGGRGPVLTFARAEPAEPAEPVERSEPARPPARSERGRLRLAVDLPVEAALTRVEAAVDAGGLLVSDAHAPRWWLLADAEGHELLVRTTPR